MNKPYPGSNPSYASYNKTGGYIRECFVIELSCLQKLTHEERCLVRERLEAVLSGFNNTLGIERSNVVLSEQFDTILRSALRIE